ARIVLAREYARQPFRRRGWRMAQRRHRAIGHRDRAVNAAFDLRQHEGARGAGHMCTWTWRRPWTGMQSSFDRERKQCMPSGMKFDLVEAMAVTVECAQHRRVGISGEAELYRFRGSEHLAERAEFVHRPVGFIAHKRRNKHTVALQQIVRLKRRRLVSDLIHRGALLLRSMVILHELVRR